MIVKIKKNYIIWTWLLIFAGFVFRCFYASSFLLVPDETNYWQWARHLSWGYHDQAPLIAWTIHATTSIFGHTELGVRFPSILAMAIASIYLMLFTRRWFSDFDALNVTILAQTILIFNIGGLLATADGLQGAAWAAASYHVARAYENNSWRQWVLGGIAFGFGMLSKYTMVLFLPCSFFFGLFSTHHRRLLRGIKPYVGCTLGVVMFLPVIFWNAANNWNSVRHVAYIGGANQKFYLHFNLLGDFLASQAALLSPLVFLLIIIGWYFIIRKGYATDKWIHTYLVFTSLPVIAGFALLSLHSRVYGNWPCAGYLTAIIISAVIWGRQKENTFPDLSPKNSRLWLWTVSTSAIITALILVHVIWPILPIPLRMDRTVDEICGWDDLGQKIGKIASEPAHTQNSFIFGLTYQMASELAFYTPGKPFTVAINRWNRPNVYDYWWNDFELIGKNAVGVLLDKRSRKRLLEIFNYVEPPEAFHIYRSRPFEDRQAGQSAISVKTFYIYRCHGFKGGLRWVPSSLNDIRSIGNDS